jgi:single-strand DNA-binding protein
MNKVFLTGNLTRDPETKTTKDGTGLCTFTVAVNNGKDTDFFRVTAWRKLADICRQYLAKGRKVAVTGSVTASAYTNKDGEPKASLEVQADNVEFLGNKNEDTYETEERKAIQEESKPHFVTVDEPLPF